MAEEKRGETFVMKDAGGAAEKPIEFTTFLLGLASSALIHLGAAPNPEDGQTVKELVLAKQTIELLGLLREKTRGNLSSDEERVFDSLLSDLRLRFVEASKR